MAFKQSRLLPTWNFEREGRRRGTLLDSGQLEALHRTGVLTPLFRLRKDLRVLRAEAVREGRSLADTVLFTPTDAEGLATWHSAGLLAVAGDEPFRPWTRYERRINGIQMRVSEFLYSPYQLLGVDTLRHAQRRMRARPRGPDDLRLRYRLRMREVDRLKIQTASVEEVVLFSAIEGHYLPLINGRVVLPWGGEEEWDRFERDFDPESLARMLGWTRDEIGRLATALLWTARGKDPASRWFRLTRNVWPRKWEELEDAALAAMDYRIAGEMVLRFFEDLGGSTKTFNGIEGERLRPEPGELDAVLSELGLSPHPGVVLVLEGQTEMTLMRLVMRHIGFHEHQRVVRLVDATGVESSLDTLAAYAVTPDLGEKVRRGVLLARPPTHLVVVRDAEGRTAATAEARERVRQRWLDRILADLPAEFRTLATREHLDPLVTVDTWVPDDSSRRVFEFAHFTDSEIARALTRWHRSHDRDVSVSKEQVATVRSTSQRIEDLVGKRDRRFLSKPELALYLWPVLRRRIDRAIERESLSSIPIARIALDTVHRARRQSGRMALLLDEG